jgi:hypothetical protein
MKLHPLLSGPKAVLISHTAVDDPVHCDGYRPAGLAIAGVNMVAVDSVASYLMGYDPQRLVCLQVTAQAGLKRSEATARLSRPGWGGRALSRPGRVPHCAPAARSLGHRGRAGRSVVLNPRRSIDG